MPRKEASTVLSIGILCAALAFFWATARRQQTLVYLLKPTTTVLILLLASGGLAASPAPAYAWAVSVALLWSLLGDILLLFPARFVAGLAAFAVAQVAYAWGLWRLAPQAFTGLDAATGLALAAFGALYFRRLAGSLQRQGEAGLRTPVAVYLILILTMIWRALALLGQPTGLPVRAWLVALGALLFGLSDSALAWDRFIAPLRRRDLLVMGTYYAAQYCFALSVAWPPV